MPSDPGDAPVRAGCVRAIVLAGGRATRFGADKTAAVVGGASVLELLLAGIARDVPVVVVGPYRRLDAARPGVVWTREQPPGGGPVAGLAAGCAALPPGADVVVVLGGDQPFSAAAVPRLLAALDTDPDADAAIGVAPDGSRQLLSLAVRLPALLAALPDRPAGCSMRHLVAGWRIVPVPLTERESLDVDTPEDLLRARSLA